MPTAEEQLQAIYAELPTVECRRKCQEYCGPLLIPRVEFVQIEKLNAFVQLAPISATVLGKEWKWMPKDKLVSLLPGHEGHCSFLFPTGKCRAYAIRPLICRLWGMVDTPLLRCPYGCVPTRWVTQKRSPFFDEACFGGACMRIILYLHSDKETGYQKGLEAGLSGEALDMAMYLGYEHKMEYEVDPKTGKGTLVTVDGRKLK